MATKTQEITAKLRKRMSDGELQPGDEIPSQAEIEREEGVSRSVSRGVLAELERLGLVYLRPGKRAIVREHTRYPWVLTDYETGSSALYDIGDDESSDEVDPWAEQVKRQGHTPDEVIDGPSIERASDDIAARLGLEPGGRVVVRLRERYVDGRLVQLADSFFPYELVKDTELMNPGKVHIRGGVLARHGIYQVRLRDEITPKMPTPEEAERLRVGRGVPVNEVVRTGYVADGTAVRVMRTLAPGDSNVIVVEQHTNHHKEGTR